jgi:hypothetical protein
LAGGRFRRLFTFHREGGALVHRHRPAALEGHLKCGLAKTVGGELD